MVGTEQLYERMEIGDIYFSSLLPDFSADLTKKSRYLRRRKKSVFYFVVKSNFLLTFLWAGLGPCEKPSSFNQYLIKNYPKNGEYLTQIQTRNFPPLLSNFDNSIAIPNYIFPLLYDWAWQWSKSRCIQWIKSAFRRAVHTVWYNLHSLHCAMYAWFFTFWADSLPL